MMCSLDLIDMEIYLFTKYFYLFTSFPSFVLSLFNIGFEFGQLVC